jgi:NAD(P)-dependent dehydrogenase (short-subunit alcohol dehydrogenase family)
MEPPPESDGSEYLASGKLRDLAALITGGDSGIGRAVAIEFAKVRANVAIVHLDEHNDAKVTKAKVENSHASCRAAGGGGAFLCVFGIIRFVVYDGSDAAS